MQGVKILFIVTIVVIILLAALVALADGDEIHEAAKEGDLETVTRLVEQDPAMLEARTDAGSTPLHYAAAYGQAPVVRYLIEGGADIDARNRELSTPLRYAAMRGMHDAARLLLEAGADTEIPDDYGRNPLLICARESGDVDMARLLLDHGAEVDATDKFGDTPIVLAAWRGFEEQVDLFLDRGASTPVDGRQGGQLVEYSVKKGLERLFAVLAAEGADFTGATETGWTKLHSASLGGSAEIAGALIDKGIDVNGRDIYGYAPVHYAAKRGRTDVVKLLVKNGATLTEATLGGDSPWNLADRWGHGETAEALASAGTPTSPPEFPPHRGRYFGLKPPGAVPEVFAPGIASTCDSEHGCITFSPDGEEAYWSTSFMTKDTGYATTSMMGTSVEGGRWTKPRFTPFSTDRRYDNDVPFFAPGGDRLFFISRRPLEAGGERGRERIWYMDREGGGWSDPRPVEGRHGAIDIHWQFAVTADGTIYFGGRGPDSRGMGDIYMMKPEGGVYGEPVNLGEPVNTENGEGSPYVTPDGSMLLFSGIGHEGHLGGSDIYVCFRQADGTWSAPVNPGEPVNSTSNDQCPMISPDGKYLFFLSHRGQTSDIWWVESSILDPVSSAR